jgi:hypothetical protein
LETVLSDAGIHFYSIFLDVCVFIWVMGISPIRLSPIGHSPMAKVHGYIGEISGCVLARVQWTFTNWQDSRGCIGESLIGKSTVSREILYEIKILQEYCKAI